MLDLQYFLLENANTMFVSLIFLHSLCKERVDRHSYCINKHLFFSDRCCKSDFCFVFSRSVFPTSQFNGLRKYPLLFNVSIPHHEDIIMAELQVVHPGAKRPTYMKKWTENHHFEVLESKEDHEGERSMLVLVSGDLRNQQ